MSRWPASATPHLTPPLRTACYLRCTLHHTLLLAVPLVIAVSYEYVACQRDNAGVLILSEFAGAAQSLGACGWMQ